MDINTYYHIVPKGDGRRIIESGCIDNRLCNGPHSIGIKTIEANINKAWREIRAFVYNKDLLMRDRFYPTLPINKTQKTIFLGRNISTLGDLLSFGFGPVIETHMWTIIAFEIHPKQKIFHREFIIKGKPYYSESFSLEPLRIVNARVITHHEFYIGTLG